MKDEKADINNSNSNLIYSKINNMKSHMQKEDFYLLASLLMRSEIEFNYIKDNFKTEKKIKNFSPTDISGFQIFEFFEQAKICYRVLQNKYNIITIIIKKDDKKNLHKLLRKKRFKKIIHPLSEDKGYKYPSDTDHFEIYKKDDKFYEFFFYLPCVNARKKEIQSFDDFIQESVWKNAFCDKGIYFVSTEDKMIFTISNGLFCKMGFCESDKKFLSANKAVFYNKSIYEKLNSFLFKQTDKIIELLVGEKFDDIIDNYYKFKKY